MTEVRGRKCRRDVPVPINRELKSDVRVSKNLKIPLISRFPFPVSHFPLNTFLLNRSQNLPVLDKHRGFIKNNRFR